MPTRDRTSDTDESLARSLASYRRLVVNFPASDEIRETLCQMEAEAERRQLAAVVSGATAGDPKRL